MLPELPRSWLLALRHPYEQSSLARLVGIFRPPHVHLGHRHRPSSMRLAGVLTRRLNANLRRRVVDGDIQL
eukprot:6214483-Pleurochrysis_carterae.AAC.2